MNYRTLVKHAPLAALLALLVLPAVASADDTVPDVGDIHVGVAEITFGGDADVASGPAIAADAEAGWHIGHVDLTGFGSYATRHVDDTFDDGDGKGDYHGHYRVHVIDLGARATLRFKHGYGGVGLAFENELESGMFHTPTGDQPVNNSDQHVAFEVRLGVIVHHVDVSGSLMFATAYDELFATARLGVGYRF